jgi:hypothetical protein
MQKKRATSVWIETKKHWEKKNSFFFFALLYRRSNSQWMYTPYVLFHSFCFVVFIFPLLLLLLHFSIEKYDIDMDSFWRLAIWLHFSTQQKPEKSKNQVYIHLSIHPNVFHHIYEWTYARMMMMMMEKRSHLPLSPVGKSSWEIRISWVDVIKNNLSIFFYSLSQNENKYWYCKVFFCLVNNLIVH